MRVLLASTNRDRSMMPPFPLGLAYVAAATEAAGHTVEAWDAMFQEDWESSLRQRVRACRPDVIGLSVRNVDDQDFRKPRFLIEEARQMAAVCREESPAPLVAGGAAIGVFPKEAFRYLGVDYAVAGEGERAFPRLLERIAAGAPPDGIPGVLRHENGRVVAAPPEWQEPLDALLPPARERLPVRHYYETPGTARIPNVIQVQTKRGCPLACNYCSTFAVEGTAIRLRAPQAVADEVAGLAAQGFQRLMFVDSVFTNPPAHAQAICEELVRRRLQIGWSATISPQFAEPELLKLMKQAGCTMVMVGSESGCTRTLDGLCKGFTREHVERALVACREAGLRTGAFLLLGGPGEDRDTVRESVEVMQRHAPNQVSVSVGIRLYPGNGLTRRAVAEGLLAPDADLLPPRFYLSPAIRDWIWEYLAPIMAADPRWVF